MGYDFEGQDIKKCVSVGEKCESLVDYLQCFDLPGKLLQTEEALTLACEDLTRRLADQGLIYSEIRFGTSASYEKGAFKGKGSGSGYKGHE